MTQSDTSTTRRAAVAGTLAAISSASLSQTAGLDGRRFDGVFLQRGKTSGDADTITFAHGRFRSSACDRYGYGDAPYRTNAVGDAIEFETETVSARYGKLQWKGKVRGPKLDATVLMLQDGKPPVENWVVAVAPR
jgi:hypothetical protein